MPTFRIHVKRSLTPIQPNTITTQGFSGAGLIPRTCGKCEWATAFCYVTTPTSTTGLVSYDSGFHKVVGLLRTRVDLVAQTTKGSGRKEAEDADYSLRLSFERATDRV